MNRKIEFRCIEFLRKVRDKQASDLEGKSSAEVIAFFGEEKAKLSLMKVRPRAAGWVERSETHQNAAAPK